MRKPPQKRRPEPWQVRRVATPHTIRANGQNRNTRFASIRFIWSRSSVTPAITTRTPKIRPRVPRVRLLIVIASTARFTGSFAHISALLGEQHDRACPYERQRPEFQQLLPNRGVRLDGEHIPYSGHNHG